MQFWTITFMFGRFIVIWGWIRVSIEKVAKYLYKCELISYKRLPSWPKLLAVLLLDISIFILLIFQQVNILCYSNSFEQQTVLVFDPETARIYLLQYGHFSKYNEGNLHLSVSDCYKSYSNQMPMGYLCNVWWIIP